MTQKKTTKEALSKISLHIKRDWLIELKHRTGKGKSKEDTGLYYRFKAFVEKYYNKWWPSVTPIK